jgi:hypothetical protein
MGTSPSTLPAPVATTATNGLSPSHVPPTGNPRASPDYAQPTQSSHGHRSDMAEFSSTGEFRGMRILGHAPRVIPATSISPPNCYRGEQDTRNERAWLNPVWYLPGLSRPPQLDVDPSSDEDGDNTQGGPIISPRHWNRMRLAQKMGISPLDAAALGYREYHGKDKGYYLLTKEIIFRCGYKDHTRTNAIVCYKDIILLHPWVMDAWVNSHMQQCGPLVDRILDKGLPVFPKLESLAVAATVDFYDKLQKTSALYLLPLMAFNTINLNTGFEGLCSPGLGLRL